MLNELNFQYLVMALFASDSSVFYVDTKNDFCPERLLEIFHHTRLLLLNDKAATAAASTTPLPDLTSLGRIKVAKAFDGAALCDVLRYGTYPLPVCDCRVTELPSISSPKSIFTFTFLFLLVASQNKSLLIL
jgi:hypothetical protein